jgi:predicted dehydrogenase
MRRDKNHLKEKIRIGIIGAGRVTRDLHLPVLINMEGVDISWICDKNERRARCLAKQYKILSVISQIENGSDVDIVLVAIPVGLRHAVMQYIFRRGWHAFCEKPFAISLADHDHFLAQARAHNVQVGVGLLRRYGAATIMAKKIVQEGHFGPITEVWASEGMRTKRTGQDADWYLTDTHMGGGGVLMETGSHLVDQLCSILNVNAYRFDKSIQRKHQDLEFETRFIGAVSNEQQQDIRCAFEVSRLEDLCNGIFIQFPNFILKCGLSFEKPLELISLNGDYIAKFNIDEGAKTISQAIFIEWQDFINQCTTEHTSCVDAHTARQSTAIIEQCYKDAEVIHVCDTMGG